MNSVIQLTRSRRQPLGGMLESAEVAVDAAHQSVTVSGDHGWS